MLNWLPRWLPVLVITPALGLEPLEAPRAPEIDLGMVGVTMPDGTPAQVRAFRFARPICLDGAQPLTNTDLGWREGAPTKVLTRSSRGSGMNIVWNVFGETSPETDAGLVLASEFYAQRFADDVTVEFDITFWEFVGGSSWPGLIYLDYETLRQLLIEDMDADDTIQTLLPPYSFPVRQFFGGAVSDQTEMAISFANARALGIEFDDMDEPDGAISVGSQVDYNPSDGIGPPTFYSGMEFLIHEVAHTMGFFNLKEFGYTQATSHDLFRFAEGGPDDPETEAEFTTFPRALYLGSFDPAQFHHFDLITTETPLENASELQASHFRETNWFDADAFRQGIMEPAIAPMESRYPTYMSRADFDALDAIGWDITGACSVADLAEPLGELNFDDVIGFLAAFGAMAISADLAEPTGVFNFDDVVAFLAAFGAGCP